MIIIFCMGVNVGAIIVYKVCGHPHASGDGLWSRRRPAYCTMDASIFKLWDDYDDHKIVCEEVLKQIGEINGS